MVTPPSIATPDRVSLTLSLILTGITEASITMSSSDLFLCCFCDIKFSIRLSMSAFNLSQPFLSSLPFSSSCPAILIIWTYCAPSCTADCLASSLLLDSSSTLCSSSVTCVWSRVRASERLLISVSETRCFFSSAMARLWEREKAARRLLCSSWRD